MTTRRCYAEESMSSEDCTDLARNAYMTARVPFLDVFPCRPDAPLPICLGRDRDLIAVLAVLPTTLWLLHAATIVVPSPFSVTVEFTWVLQV